MIYCVNFGTHFVKNLIFVNLKKLIITKLQTVLEKLLILSDRKYFLVCTYVFQVLFFLLFKKYCLKTKYVGIDSPLFNFNEGKTFLTIFVCLYPCNSHDISNEL